MGDPVPFPSVPLFTPVASASETGDALVSRHATASPVRFRRQTTRPAKALINQPTNRQYGQQRTDRDIIVSWDPLT